MKYKLVYLEWADAIANASWKTEDSLQEWIDSDDWIVKTVGWLYEETDKYIVTFSTITPPQERNNEEPQFTDIRKIPKTWIRKRKVLKI